MKNLEFCKCGQIKGQCDCQKKRVKTTTERGLGYDWQKLSTQFRRMFPLCWRCLKRKRERGGRVEVTAHAHHIIPRREEPLLRLEIRNLAALCADDHEAEDERYRQGIIFDAYPDDWPWGVVEDGKLIAVYGPIDRWCHTLDASVELARPMP